jgi:phosphoglycerol transferase MdoB-like AlkP superfamily enzyme
MTVLFGFFRPMMYVVLFIHYICILYTIHDKTMEKSDSLSFYFRTFVRLVVLSTIVGFLLRIILMLNGQTTTSFVLKDYFEIFIFGIVNDVCVAFIGTIFIFIDQLFRSPCKYRSPLCYVILGFFVAAFVYLFFFDNALTEFNKHLTHIVCWILLYKCISFSLRAFLPRIRENYSMVIYVLMAFLYVAILFVNTIGEYFFWSEFGVRYNFIAVDYLIYTNEVVGNIMESYPIVPIFVAIALLSLFITYLVIKNGRKIKLPVADMHTKLSATAIYILLITASCFVLTLMSKLQTNNNVYVNELQANGLFKFYNAFWANKLDYDQFYLTLSRAKVEKVLGGVYHSNGMDNITEQGDTLPELHRNIVLIMVESLSAEYLSAFGNKQHITPQIDALIPHSMMIENFYANGNRTVRGLEAVTLSIPPSPGESIIKRTNNNKKLYSVATVLKEKGYRVQFLYGGDSYFDNMKSFFLGNGYEVIDKNNMLPGEVTFSTVWGACDENLFGKSLKVFDRDAASGRPFFAHIMTTSNHRPYLYPDGRIDIPSSSKSREGAVKYTDYAIGEFIKAAQKKPWFKNTIFAIVADHCASSAGSTEVPLDQYHIPALIYAPGFVRPSKINKLVSQMDIMPTIFGLLHFKYRSRFYGQNVLLSAYKPRAVVATYQNLGYLRNNIFTVLSPTRKEMQQRATLTIGRSYTLTPLKGPLQPCLDEAIAHYQSLAYRK